MDDDVRQYYKDITALACDPATDRTRQEDKAATDINLLLHRFGVQVDPRIPTIDPRINQRPIQYGTETDYTQDLQTNMDAQRQAQVAWTRLPEHAKQRWPTWRHLLAALASGEIADFTRKPPPPETPPLTPAT